MTKLSIMKKVPLCIIEEHHEAFLLWHYAIKKDIIRYGRNVLLHFDSHADMMPPSLQTSIQNLPYTSIFEFTYTELGVSSFIIPAIYQKILNSIYWVVPNKYDKQIQNKYITTYQNNGKQFIVSDNLPEQNSFHGNGGTFFTMLTMSLDEEISVSQPVILDIDLDFFSCDDNMSIVELEITKSEFDKYKSNKYHSLRLMDNCHVGQKGENYTNCV